MTDEKKKVDKLIESHSEKGKEVIQRISFVRAGDKTGSDLSDISGTKINNLIKKTSVPRKNKKQVAWQLGRELG